MDPEPTTPIKIRKRTPEEALEYQTLKLVEVYQELKALKYARWAMFKRSELAVLVKGLGYVILELQSRNPAGPETEAHALLETLLDFVNDHTRQSDSPSTKITDQASRGGE